MYSIVDIETTGLSPHREKITEIAIYVHDGEKVVDEFTTLLNPEIEIPYRITQLTGINNKMVKDSPKFYEIARHVVEMTEGTVFVGHNVHFDYNFVRKEFRELGYDYHRKQICTAKLSRKLLPGRRSYSLGKLCQELGIENPHRHRAYGDAQATLRLFEILLSAEKNLYEISFQGLNTSLDRNLIEKLPTEPGVYYFFNEKNVIIYIGKSKNIKERVISHLTNNGSRRAIEMRNEIADIGYELTGNELIALLLESSEIKKHLPRYNRAQRRTGFIWGLYCYTDNNGYLRLKLEKNTSGYNPLTTFSSALSGKNQLFVLSGAFNLCQKLCGLYETNGACFQYSIHQCNGACMGAEPPQKYNSRVLQAIEPYKFKNNSFIIIEKGRHKDENAYVIVENGHFLGYGYINYDINENPEIKDLKKSLQINEDNHDTQQILKSYLRKNKPLKFIPI